MSRTGANATKPGDGRGNPGAPADAPEGMKKFEGAITIEQSFKVDGQKLTVLVTFPGEVVKDVGMEKLLLATNRAIVSLESKTLRVEKFKP